MQDRYPAEAMKLRDFLARYGISRSTAFEQMAAGRLKARRLGSHLLISKKDADAWLTSLPERAPHLERKRA